MMHHYRSIVFVLLFCHFSLMGFSLPSDVASAERIEQEINATEIIDPDSVLDALTPMKAAEVKKTNVVQQVQLETSTKQIPTKVTEPLDSTSDDDDIPTIANADSDAYSIDSLVLEGNPFFIDLVYTDQDKQFDWGLLQDYHTLFHGPRQLLNDKLKPKEPELPEVIVQKLRKHAYRDIVKNATHLLAYNKDQLPDVNSVEQIILTGKPVKKLKFVDDNPYVDIKNEKMNIDELVSEHWWHKGTAMAQFSGGVVSDNWYKGGNNNLAVLGIVSEKLNYNNKKRIQWENAGEWRLGFNADGSSNQIATNEDVLKINSKVGFKLVGDFFLNGSMDLNTQFFESYSDKNQSVVKATFLTPFRYNAGLGFDLKYKKLMSVVVNPLTYKLIYVNDIEKVDPKQFGIPNGQHVLSEMGSSVRITNSFSPVHEIQIDSKFYLYTNYKKVEADWEIVCNLIVNRFISTRISVNPRFDNTKLDGTAPLQFKGMMSVGVVSRF